MTKIGKYNIRNFFNPFIIAEIGSNHNGDINLAKKMIDAAAGCGCHSVKFQSWTKSSLFSERIYHDNKELESQIELYSLSLQQLTELKHHCDKKKIIFSTSVFSKREANFFVDELKVKFIKVASMDLNNYPLLEHVAKKGKPIILSTGLGSLAEISKAYDFITQYNKNLILLHCVALYPPKDKQVNLNNIDMLRNNFDCPIGFSDHTIGTSIPLAAVVKGASVIEKHFTLDKNMSGWDHAVSANVAEMKEIVSQSKRITRALGKYRRIVSKDDLEKRKVFRRSIMANKNLRKNKKIKRNDIILLRPGTGIEPQMARLLINKTVNKNIRKGELISWEDLG